MKLTRSPLSTSGDTLPDSTLLTVKEACERLRISSWSFYRLIHQRQLTSIRIGRRRFVSTSAIQEFINQHSEELG